jgi:hypothetical protein
MYGPTAPPGYDPALQQLPQVSSQPQQQQMSQLSMQPVHEHRGIVDVHFAFFI